MKTQRPATRLGLASNVPEDRYEQRPAKPARNRVQLKPPKVKSSKPAANQVARIKR